MPSPSPNNTTAFHPYVVDPSLFSPAANVTVPGNLSLPQLATAMMGAEPVFYLLAVDVNGSESSLDLFVGVYSPVVAADSSICGHFGPGGNCGGGKGGLLSTLQAQAAPDPCGNGKGGGRHGNGSECSSLPPSTQPLAWSAPHVIVTIPHFQVVSDTLSADGTALSAAASVSDGTTLLFSSTDGGMTWGFIDAATGAGARVATTEQYAVLTTLGSSLTVSSVDLTTNFTRSVTLGPALNATPVVFPDGMIGVAASHANGTILYYDSSDGGATFSAHLIGRFSPT